jgi:hypothetical protein
MPAEQYTMAAAILGCLTWIMFFWRLIPKSEGNCMGFRIFSPKSKIDFHMTHAFSHVFSSVCFVQNTVIELLAYELHIWLVLSVIITWRPPWWAKCFIVSLIPLELMLIC